MSTVTRFDPPTGDEAVSLERLSAVVDAFRLIDPKMPTSYVSAYLAVARKPGLGPTQYAKMCGTIQPIMSRILLDMGSYSRDKSGPGLELVDRVVDDVSLRNQRYYLTSKGRQLKSQIMRYLSD